MATITGNYVYADPTQWWTLDYTFANSKFTWSVTAHASFTSYWNSIYGLTVNVGGNSYYKGDIDWRNYTPNTVVYSGTTNLSDCTVQNGVVTLSVSGNFYYGTWSADYRSSGSGTCAVDPPTVDALTYTATNKYSNMVVAGRSVITFTMKGTSRTGSTSMSYSLYQDGSVISTTTGTSGTAKTVNVTAPSAGSHTYKYVATDGNGTTTTSGNISITTYAYTPPSFSSVSAVRWSTGTSSGTASDEGTYCKATANFSQGKVGTTAITTTCTIKVDTYTGTATNGTAIWLGGGNLSADNTYQVTFTLSDGYGNSVVTTDTLTQGGRGIDLIYGSGHYGVAIGQKATANRVDINMATNVNTGNITVPNGNLTVGTNGSTSADRYIVFNGGAGQIGLYAGASTTGKRTLYASAHGTGSSVDLFSVDTNNNVITNVNRIQAGNRPYYVMQPVSSGSTDILLDTERLTLRSGTASVALRYNPEADTNKVTRSSGFTIASNPCYFWGRVAQVTLVLNCSGSVTAGNNIFTGTLASGWRPKADVMGMSYYTNGGFVGWLKTDGSITIRAIDSISFGSGTLTISWTYIW